MQQQQLELIVQRNHTREIGGKAMSFDIQWDTICNDAQLALSLREFLNSKLSTVELPHYLANLQVVDFKFGKAAPEITIRDIDIPFSEFYTSDSTQKEDEDSVARKNEVISGETSHVDSQEQNINTTEDQENGDLTGKNRISALKNRILPTSRSPSPHPFINNPNSILMPRTNSGFTPTLSHMGVGLGGFRMGGGNGQLNSTNSGSGSMESESDYFQPENNVNESAVDDGKVFSGLLNGGFGVPLNGVDAYSDGDLSNYTNHQSNFNGIPNNGNASNTNNSSFSSGDGYNNLDTSLDVQLSVDVKWDSQLYIEIICDLLVNYPAPEFIRLPVRLKITDLKIHSLMVVACISKKVFISFLCDIDSDDGNGIDDGDNSNLGNTTESRQDSRRSAAASTTFNKRSKGKERIDILQDMKIEGEIGNVSEGAELWRENLLKPLQQQHFQNLRDLSNQNAEFNTNSSFLSGIVNNDEIGDGNGLVLRNIGKIEKFLMTAFRGLIIDELAWPGWIELDFNESIPETDDEMQSDEEDGDAEKESEAHQEDDSENYIHKTASGITKLGRSVTGNSRLNLPDDKQGLRSLRSLRSTSTEGGLRPSSFVDDSSLYSSDSYFTSDGEQ